MDSLPALRLRIAGLTLSPYRVESACTRSTMSAQLNYDWNSSSSDVNSYISVEQPNDSDSPDDDSPRTSTVYVNISQLSLTSSAGSGNGVLGGATAARLRTLSYQQRRAGGESNGFLRSKRHAIYGEPTNPVFSTKSGHTLQVELTVPAIQDNSKKGKRSLRSASYHMALAEEQPVLGGDDRPTENSPQVIRDYYDVVVDVTPKGADVTTPMTRAINRLLNSLRQRNL